MNVELPQGWSNWPVQRQLEWMRRLALKLPNMSVSSRVRPDLTQRSVDAARPRQGEYTLWDHAVIGLGLRVRESGSKSFVLVYRPRGRTKVRRVTLGKSAILNLRDVREMARGMMAEVYRGHDPSDQRRQRRSTILEAVYRESMALKHFQAGMSSLTGLVSSAWQLPSRYKGGKCHGSARLALSARKNRNASKPL